MPFLPPTPPAVVKRIGTQGTAYTPIPCEQLAAAIGKQSGAISAYYGSLMTEALHRHGFDTAWPHVPAEVIGHAMTDWSGCFMPESPPGKQTPPRK